MRTPVFNDRHHRLIAEAISGSLNGETSDEAAKIIDALQGLFSADDPGFNEAQFQEIMEINIGPVSRDATYHGLRILDINGIGE